MLIDVYMGEAEDEEQNGGIKGDGNESGYNDVNDDEEDTGVEDEEN